MRICLKLDSVLRYTPAQQHCTVLNTRIVKSKEELPQKVAEYLRGEKKEKLDKLIQEGNISIKFNEYDWSTNNVNSLTYAKGDLSDKCVFPYSRNPPPQKYNRVQD